MDENDTPSTPLSGKQDLRLPPTENMDTGDALQIVAKAGWRVAAFNHADEFWQNLSPPNEKSYRFGHVVLETKDGKIIRSHKGLCPPAFMYD